MTAIGNEAADLQDMTGLQDTNALEDAAVLPAAAMAEEPVPEEDLRTVAAATAAGDTADEQAREPSRLTLSRRTGEGGCAVGP